MFGLEIRGRVILVLAIAHILASLCASLVAQRVKRLPTMRETRVRSLGWEGNSNPLQYSWLENPMDGGVW